jgi:hypothetical protein
MRSFLRVLKFAALGIVALISAWLVWLAVANAPANAQIDEKLAKAHAAGEPVTIADLAANRPAPERNALTYLQRAEDTSEAINREVHEVWKVEEARQLEQGQQVPESFDYSPTMIDAYRKAFAAHPTAIVLLFQASECPEYFLDLDYDTDSGSEFVADMLPKVQMVRAATRVLNYRVLLLLSEGKREEALDTCLAMLRLSNLFSGAPTLVGQLVAIAIRNVSINATNRVLRDGTLPPEAYDRLEAELARQDFRDAYRRSLITERAVGMAHFDDMRMVYSGLPHGKRDQASYLELFEVIIANAHQPYGSSDAQAAYRAAMNKAGPLTKLLGPAIEAANEAVTRNEAQARCLRVLNAILRRAPEDQADVKLDDLNLPKGTTTDPFNGQPLHLRHTDAGWLIYSVGGNLKDDGGQTDDDANDVGSAPIVSP